MQDNKVDLNETNGRMILESIRKCGIQNAMVAVKNLETMDIESHGISFIENNDNPASAIIVTTDGIPVPLANIIYVGRKRFREEANVLDIFADDSESEIINTFEYSDAELMDSYARIRFNPLDQEEKLISCLSDLYLLSTYSNSSDAKYDFKLDNVRIGLGRLLGALRRTSTEMIKFNYLHGASTLWFSCQNFTFVFEDYKSVKLHKQLDTFEQYDEKLPLKKSLNPIALKKLMNQYLKLGEIE